MTGYAARALALVLVAWSVQVPAQKPTFSSRVEAVRLDALVTDNGRPVRDLGAADFEVFDNGVLQQVDFVNLEQLPLNVILVLDMSGSVAGDRLVHLRDASLALLDGLKKEDQAALVTFSHVVTRGSGLTGDLAVVRAAVGRADPLGNTSLIDAAFSGLVLGESDVGRNLLIVFSDGVDTSSWLTEDAVLETARRCDVVVYTVSAMAYVEPKFLRDLSNLTGGSLFEIESTKDLRGAFLAALEEFRQRYLLSYSPTGVATDGWHKIEVRIRGRNLKVKARAGYLAGAR
jgi:VWFA-related protein